MENVNQIKRGITINLHVSGIWNPSTCSCENDNCSESIIGDEIIKVMTKTAPIKNTLTKSIPTKTVLTNSIKKR